MHRIYNPVDPSITSNSFVLRINKDDFEILVRRILVDPVRVEHAQIGTAAAHTFFGRGPECTLVLELVHTLVRGFTCIIDIRKKNPSSSHRFGWL